MIEDAHRLGAGLGLAVWNQDEAGPYQAIPQPGASWQPQGQPERRPHEYVRGGTAKMLTLLHPDTRAGAGARGDRLHERGAARLAQAGTGRHRGRTARGPPPPGPTRTGPAWERWREGLSVRFTLRRAPAAACGCC